MPPRKLRLVTLRRPAPPLPPENRGNAAIVLPTESEFSVMILDDRGRIREVPAGARLVLPLYWYSRPTSRVEKDLETFVWPLKRRMSKELAQGALYDDTLTVLDFYDEGAPEGLSRGFIGAVSVEVPDGAQFALSMP